MIEEPPRDQASNANIRIKPMIVSKQYQQKETTKKIKPKVIPNKLIAVPVVMNQIVPKNFVYDDIVQKIKDMSEIPQL